MSNARRPTTTARNRQLTSAYGNHDERHRQVPRVLVDSRRRGGGNRRGDEAEAMTCFARTPETQRDWVAETPAEAAAENERRVAALMDREPAIAAVIEACRSDAPCGSVPCFECARRFRRRFRGEMRRVAKVRGGTLELATIYLETITHGSLENVSVKRAHDRLRAQMRRSGFGNSIVIGGTEAAWKAREQIWILHVHALAIGVDAEAWDALEEKLAKSGRAMPLLVKNLNDPKRQLSYAQKFVTYHRPGRRTGKRPALPYPLPRDRLVELVRWWTRHRFEDFPFLFGARRRGGRIVPER